MCPTLLSVAVIKHSAEATWEGKGLCGLHSSGNALEGKIQSESQTATDGERLMSSGSCSVDIQTQHRTSRSETVPHASRPTPFSHHLTDVGAGRSDLSSSSDDTRLCPTTPKGTQEQGISGHFAIKMYSTL